MLMQSEELALAPVKRSLRPTALITQSRLGSTILSWFLLSAQVPLALASFLAYHKTREVLVREAIEDLHTSAYAKVDQM